MESPLFLFDLLTAHEPDDWSAGLRYGSTVAISHEPCPEAGAPVHGNYADKVKPAHCAAGVLMRSHPRSGGGDWLEYSTS